MRKHLFLLSLLIGNIAPVLGAGPIKPTAQDDQACQRVAPQEDKISDIGQCFSDKNGESRRIVCHNNIAYLHFQVPDDGFSYGYVLGYKNPAETLFALNKAIPENNLIDKKKEILEKIKNMIVACCKQKINQKKNFLQRVSL
jgi:hypothetical protein